MKKIILSLVLIIGLMFSTVFSYNLNTKDTNLINKINKKFDLIYKKSPSKIEDIYEKVQNLLNVKLKWKENSRIYKIISWLNIHLEEILNKNEEKIDIDSLLFWEEKDKINDTEKDLKKSVDEYYTDNKWRKFKIYDPRDKSYLNKWFSCKTKNKYCKEMDSCEEATYYYKVCGAKWFDRDKDLIPCENICWEKIKHYEL